MCGKGWRGEEEARGGVAVMCGGDAGRVGARGGGLRNFGSLPASARVR